jgi:hypothetical protein
VKGRATQCGSGGAAASSGQQSWVMVASGGGSVELGVGIVRGDGAMAAITDIEGD